MTFERLSSWINLKGILSLGIITSALSILAFGVAANHTIVASLLVLQSALLLLALLTWRRVSIQARSILEEDAAEPLTGNVLIDLGNTLQSLRNARDESQLRYDLLIRNLAAAIVLRDEQQQIIFCSPYTEVLTGYPIKEILESSNDFFASIVHEDDKADFQKALSLVEMGDAFQFRYRFYHRSGFEMWAETRTVPIYDDRSNQLLGSLSITLDVTGTVRYQKQVEEQNKDLNDFAYMVSHDLKAPIYTVKGMASILEEETKGELHDDALEAMQHIKKAIKSLENLVSGILEYSRISRSDLSLVEVDLNQTIENVLSDFSALIQDTSAEIQCDDSFPTVLGDSLSLYQIVSNLIGNALKYRSPERAPRIFVRTQKTSSRRFILLEIEDNGIGISEDNLERIFRPFQRVKGNTQEGLGIGLACVKKLLDRLGGDITVTSAEGEGTLFQLKLKTPSEVNQPA